MSQSAAQPTPPARVAPGATEPLVPALGAILAGGESRRYGSVKALATVGDTPIVERVSRALSAAVTDPVLVTHLPEISARLGLPTRPDHRRVGGPLAGVETALRWAEERGLPGALCVACDLPFLAPALLRALARRGLESGAAAVLPESAAPPGVEPLCGWWAVGARPEVESAIDRGERSVARVARSLDAQLFTLAELRAYGDPAVLFLNVNTPEGRRDAERIARAEESPSE